MWIYVNIYVNLLVGIRMDCAGLSGSAALGSSAAEYDSATVCGSVSGSVGSAHVCVRSRGSVR
jgi:hypothetical protein